MGTAFVSYKSSPPAFEHDYFTFYNRLRLNASSGFTDISPLGLTVTTTGNVAVSSSQSKFNGVSFSFDGNGDTIVISESPNNGSLDFYGNTVPFRFECWIYPTSLTGTQMILCKRLNSTFTTSNYRIFLSGSTLRFEVGASAVGTIANVPINQWSHIRFQRNSSLSRFEGFLNGVMGATFASVNQGFSSDAVRIGGDSDGNYFNGYIDDISYTKYVNIGPSASFTVPAVPAVSIQPPIITTAPPSYGDQTPEAFFAKASTATTSGVAGSFIFPTKESYVRTKTATVSGDWTYECSIVNNGGYIESFPTMLYMSQGVYSVVAQVLSNNPTGAAQLDKGLIDWTGYSSAAYVTLASPIARFSRFHVAICWIESQKRIKFLVNGTVLTTVSGVTSIPLGSGSWQMFLGGSGSGTEHGTPGYFGPWRFTNGTALY